MSAITLLGNPAEMYNYGTQFVLIGVAYLLTTPIAAYLFMPVYHRLGLTSAYEVRIQNIFNFEVWACKFIASFFIAVLGDAL